MEHSISPEPNASAPSLVAVVACTPGGVIGLDGAMPWKLSSDLRRFKTLTMGGTLVMGRKTFASIGRPLPGRQTIVLTRNPLQASQAPLFWVTDVQAALQLSIELARPTYVVGGAEIYRLFFPHCDEIWLTRVLADVSGDTRIDLPLAEFSLLESTTVPISDSDDFATEFQKWRRGKNSVPKNDLSH